ncbi:MAG: serine/threonine protein kinase [Proteobacteria bacterium]|nr:serine/threonine protein kinase [Pseudomonadota bacterium]
MTYQPGDILQNRYLIKEKVGSGAMGEVYRAEHITLHKEVAIKLMNLQIAENPLSLARFKREASAAAHLEHPHICHVTDFDTTESGDFYIVMEFLNGETLQKRIKREGKIEIASIFRIMNELLSALEVAHKSGIIHRDIKPGNIILENRNDRDDYVKLIDFGIAHSQTRDSLHGTLTQNGQIYGTPQYLSPEQVMGDPVDLRSDLYSCGCVLFEMLEGHPPFSDQNYVILLNQHLVLAPPHLTTDIECAQELDEVIQKLLQKSPEDRYESAKELRETLNQIVYPGSSLNLRLFNGDNELSVNPHVLNYGSAEPQGSQRNVNSSLAINGMSGESRVITNLNIQAMSPGISAVSIARIIFWVILAATVFNLAWLQRQYHRTISGHLPSGAQSNNQNYTVTSFKLSEEQLHEFAEAECDISSDPILAGNEKIRLAAKECQIEHYDESFNILNSVKETYPQNIHFTTMMMLDAYALGKEDEVIQDIVHILDLEPASVCDTAIHDIIYAMTEDDTAYDHLHTQFKLIESSHAAEGLAWLILLTPCNEYQTRFNRLLENYNTIGDESIPKWLSKAVSIWGPFKPTGNCDNRQQPIDKIVLEGLEEACRGNSSGNALCTTCFDIWHQRTEHP